MNSDSSAERAPISFRSRRSSKTRCIYRGRKKTMSSAELKPLRTRTRHLSSALTCVIVAVNAPYSKKFRSGRVTSQPPSFISASNAATSGKMTEISRTMTFLIMSTVFSVRMPKINYLFCSIKTLNSFAIFSKCPFLCVN